MANKLKYLLVMPRFVQNVGDGYQFPLGLPYVSSSMKKAGYEIYTINLNHIEGDIYDLLRKKIEEYNINVVLIGGLSVHYNSIRLVVESAKKIDSNIITVVGGGIITSDPETAMMALEYADYGVIGEGEITNCELCSALENNKQIHDVNGLIYKSSDGRYIKTKPREEIQDINSLPWPDYEGFEFEKSLQNAPGFAGMNSRKSVFMITSRSCPYRCTFCFHTTGNKYRQRSLDDFFNELDYMIKKYGIEYLCLEDELFAINIERVQEFCKRVKKYNVKYWVQLRVSDITEEMLSVLKDSGCDTIGFGLESADNRILKSMNKGTTIEQIEHALKLVYDAEMYFQGNFIFGDVEETTETANNTINWWKNNPQYRIDLTLIMMYPGTKLYKYACDKGIIKDKVKYLRDGCPQVNVSKLSDVEFGELLKNLLSLSKSVPKRLLEVEYSNIDYETGRVDVKGVCAHCKNKESWKDIKLLVNNFVGCRKCGQKYNVSLPTKVRKNIDNNVLKLLEKYDSIGLWGMNSHSCDLVENSNVFKEGKVSLIDISETAQKMYVSDKKVNSPDIIATKNIKVVIVALPHHFVAIEERIRKEYESVVKVVNIIEIIDPNYEV